MDSLTDLYNQQIVPLDEELEKQAAEMWKQAEEEDAAGRIMARGFADELSKLAAPNLTGGVVQLNKNNEYSVAGQKLSGGPSQTKANWPMSKMTGGNTKSSNTGYSSMPGSRKASTPKPQNDLGASQSVTHSRATGTVPKRG